jgi:hypothetical protein
MTHRELFDAVRDLSPLRVVSVVGPSVFESICRLDRYVLADGYLNVITDAYHWHVELGRLRHLRARDQVHERSGRRVLFVELREAADDETPFLTIYVHRAKGAEFEPGREARFAALLERAAQGCEVMP